MRYAFDSLEAKALNRDIFETIYFAAMTASKDLAIKDGAYETFKGSPTSKGIFQFDMWNVTPTDRWDWASLKRSGKTRYSQLAPAGTYANSIDQPNFRQQRMFRPYTSNIYSRRVLSGEFVVNNIPRDLIELGI